MKRIRRITICLIIIVLALVDFVKPAQVFATDEEYKNAVGDKKLEYLHRQNELYKEGNRASRRALIHI